MPWSHQRFRFVPTMKLLGSMLRNRHWPTTFHTITARDASRWCQKRPVWSAYEIEEQILVGRLVQIQDFRQTSDPFRGTHRIFLNYMQKNQKMLTFKRLALETLGSWLIIMPKILLPVHCAVCFSILVNFCFHPNSSGLPSSPLLIYLLIFILFYKYFGTKWTPWEWTFF